MPTQRGKDWVIGLDSSTTACKAIVWDCSGRMVAEWRVGLPLFRPKPAWHEQPAEAWWEAAAEALRQITGRVDINRLAALSIAAQRETFVPVNEEYRPLCPAIVWMDERCRALLPGLGVMLGYENIHQTTGKPLSGNLALGKIAWLGTYKPEVFSRTAHYLDVHAYLAYHLTGRAATSWGCADPLGLFDMQHQRWAEDLLSGIGVRIDQLPEALPVGTFLGTLTQRAAQTCGLPVGLPVIAGIGDGQACGLGAGVTRSGESYLNLGTAVVSGTYTEQYRADPAYRTMFGGIPGSYLLETVLLGGAYTIAWFLENFGQASASTGGAREIDWDALAREVPPGALGLLLVPYWNSAMNPYWDASASGMVVGWRGVHQRQHLYRAILEGIAFEQRLHTEGVSAALRQPVDRFLAVGGGSTNRLWCQILADVTGKVVRRPATSEASALGAGILAASGIGLFPDVRQAVAAMTRVEPNVFEPDAKRQAFYSRLYVEVYRQLFPALQVYLQKLAELVETQNA